MAEPLLEIQHLYKYFPVKGSLLDKQKKFVNAVDDVSLVINKGEILGIVGESGCGKSTLVNTVLCLHPPTKGKVVFEGKSLFDLKKEELRTTRKDIQIVFQDPFWSLNPRMLVKDIVGEPLNVQTRLNASERFEKVIETLEMVGLSADQAFLYPHEFSNGQRQRIAIARALVLMPKMIVLDEPTSSIDVVSQAAILDLLLKLKNKFDLTYILISHDLGVVNYLADKIAVMYLGKLVEYGDADIVFNHPKHPYTKALFAAIPTMETRISEIKTLQGNVPSAIDVPSGCRFHDRCDCCMECCKKEVPELITLPDGIQVACHLERDRENERKRC